MTTNTMRRGAARPVPHRRALRRAAMWCCVVALAVGCSSGIGEAKAEPPPETEPATMSRDDFVAAFSQRCGAIISELNAITPPTTAEETVQAMEQAKSVVGRGLNDLGALRPPPEMQGNVSAALDVRSQSLGSFDALIEAARNGDQARVDAVTAENRTRQDEFDQRLAAMGMTCAP
ncbi:MAG: hypothetical protein R2704_12605 [Microthrixaceae bacterium]